jgi:hypothetical protein
MHVMTSKSEFVARLSRFTTLRVGFMGTCWWSLLDGIGFLTTQASDPGNSDHHCVFRSIQYGPDS